MSTTPPPAEPIDAGGAMPTVDPPPAVAPATTTTPPRLGLLDRLSEGQTTALVILLGLLLYIPFAGTYGLLGSRGRRTTPRSRAR